MDYFELRKRLYDRLQNGYYDNLPPYSFSMDELYLNHIFGMINETQYCIEKQRLEMLRNQENYEEKK